MTVTALDFKNYSRNLLITLIRVLSSLLTIQAERLAVFHGNFMITGVRHGLNLALDKFLALCISQFLELKGLYCTASNLSHTHTHTHTHISLNSFVTFPVNRLTRAMNWAQPRFSLHGKVFFFLITLSILSNFI